MGQSKSSPSSFSGLSTSIPILNGKYSPQPGYSDFQSNISPLCNVMSSPDIDIVVTSTSTLIITV